MRVLSDV